MMANTKTKGAGPEQGALRTTKKIEQNNTFTLSDLLNILVIVGEMAVAVPRIIWLEMPSGPEAVFGLQEDKR